MTQTIGIHSFRRGTGKTFLSSNLSLLLARQSWRVGLIDTNFHSPDVASLFGFGNDDVPFTLNDYLDGVGEAEEMVYEVTERLPGIQGQVFIIPASRRHEDIAKILRNGFSVERLSTGMQKICRTFSLDALVMDSPAGLTEESLRSLALADTVGIVLLPDQQHFQGTAVITDLASKLNIPSVRLIVNQVPEIFEPSQVKKESEAKYQTPVSAVLPFVEECESHDRFFVLQYPEHPFTIRLMQMVLELLK